MSVHRSVSSMSNRILFPDDNLSKHQWNFTKLGMCIDILEFRQILMELSAQDTPIFLFPDDNVCKCWGILTKVCTCIDIKEIWFGIAKGQILSVFDRVICPQDDNGGVL